jgi:hypothetical protein
MNLEIIIIKILPNLKTDIIYSSLIYLSENITNFVILLRHSYLKNQKQRLFYNILCINHENIRKYFIYVLGHSEPAKNPVKQVKSFELNSCKFNGIIVILDSSQTQNDNSLYFQSLIMKINIINKLYQSQNIFYNFVFIAILSKTEIIVLLIICGVLRCELTIHY